MDFIPIDFLVTLLLFMIVLSFIVFIHELGHFLPARYFGVKVDVFSIGFGKEIFGWTDARGTRWKFSWVPLGGYVRFFGDADVASTSVDKTLSEQEKSKSLYSRSVKERMIVSVGGPAANYLLAIVLFFGVFFFNGRPEVSAKIDSFVEGSPAKAAGMLVGDEITSINDNQVGSFEGILTTMMALKEPAVRVTVRRGEVAHQFMFLANSIKTKDGERYVLGVKGGRGSAFQFASSLVTALTYPFEISWSTLISLKQMILKTSMDGLGGPIAIAKGIKTAASVGLAVVVFYAALISTSLGFFNLLPIPTLDGGHLLFYTIEAIRGRPVNEKVQEWLFTIGFGALILLLLFVTYKDVFLK